MDILNYIISELGAHRHPDWRSHVAIVGVAAALAILTGVPIGVAISQNRRVADAVLYVAPTVIMTIPSIALLRPADPDAVADRARALATFRR